MTTIETFEDILAAMDRDPKLHEALRQRILDEEFRRLPAIVRELQEAVAQLARTLQDFMQATNERLARLETGQARLEAGQAKLEAGQEELRADQSDLRAGFGRMEKRQDTMEEDIRVLKTDMAEVRGQLVPLAARRMVGRIADVTQSRRPRWLDNTDIIDISDDADTTDVPPNELESFRAIDLALRAVDKNSAGKQQQYVIIECSGTITRNDIARIARNAEYMTRFTGLPTKAVVIGYTLPDVVAEAARERSVHCLIVTSRSTRPR